MHKHVQVHVYPGNHHVVQANEVSLLKGIQISHLLKVSEHCVIVAHNRAPHITPESLNSLVVNTSTSDKAPFLYKHKKERCVILFNKQCMTERYFEVLLF
ncbi:hypothetical protein DPEC_G00001120, partial [Dallia pectoralis]